MFSPLLSAPWELQALLLFCGGAIVGSFLNVVILRLPRGRSIVAPGSRCAKCGCPVPAWMNIPIFSFLIFGGACRRCRWPYSSRYLWIELLAGIFTVALWNIYGWSTDYFVYLLFTWALLVVTFVDLDLKIIPDEISIGGWVLALVVALVAQENYVLSFRESFFASVLGFFVFWAVSKVYFGLQGEHGLGGGDVKLMGFVGAILGYQGVLTTILIGSLLGAVVGLSMMLLAKKTRKYAFPFGPFLVLGAFANVFQLDDWIWLVGIDL